jgi:hypothetical protein
MSEIQNDLRKLAAELLGWIQYEGRRRQVEAEIDAMRKRRHALAVSMPDLTPEEVRQLREMPSAARYWHERQREDQLRQLRHTQEQARQEALILSALEVEHLAHEQVTAELSAAASRLGVFASQQNIDPTPLIRLLELRELDATREAFLVLKRVEMLCESQSGGGKLAGRLPADHAGEDDRSAYIRGKMCRNDEIRTPRQLKTLLSRVPNNASGIRRYHKGVHLWVHSGDWHRWESARLKDKDQLHEEIASEAESNIRSVGEPSFEQMAEFVVDVLRPAPKKPRGK